MTFLDKIEAQYESDVAAAVAAAVAPVQASLDQATATLAAATADDAADAKQVTVLTGQVADLTSKLAAAQAAALGYDPVCGMPAWSDEFTAAALDLTKWAPQTGHEKQNLDAYFLSPNAFVSNGQLTLRLQKDAQKVMDGQTLNYSSAYLLGKYSQRYGVWEARIKALPGGQSSGAWPSFWLRADGALGENDIYEAVGTPNAHPTIYPTDGSAFSSTMYSSTGVTKLATGMYKLAGTPYDFHTYRCVWDTSGMTNYVDGVQTLKVTDPALQKAFPTTANIHLSLFAGDAWASRVTAKTLLPQDVLVDYVRVYKLPS